MKTTIKLFIFTFFVLILSCTKIIDTQGQFMSNATITGPDLTMCACCGGWLITINSQVYRFDTVPAASNIKLLNETFPLQVRLNWQHPVNPCPENKIIVLKMKKI